VAAYLQEHGYRIIPVRPAQAQILSEKAYASLDDLVGPLDIIDVFRSPDQVLSHAHEALRLKPKVFWMQEGIENQAAAMLLTAAGIDVVMNRCIKREHGRLGV
jgi:predicted CoA-binding protein